jgi:translation initiation factor 2A
VLVKTSTDVDKSGASYYGSTGLYLLHADGGFESSVPLPKEGPVSDAKWAPTSRGFVVIAGTMPAAATLFDLAAKPLLSFGAAHRNVASWAPHGRFLAIAGFGNLAGDMDFWCERSAVAAWAFGEVCHIRRGR